MMRQLWIDITTVSEIGMFKEMTWFLVILPLTFGLNFNVTPTQVIVDDPSSTLTLICSVNESDVYSIYITRALPPCYGTDEVVATFVFETATVGDKVTDDKRLPGIEVIGKVSMYRAKLTCSDAKLYRCFYTNSRNRQSKITLHVLVLPQMIPPLHARRNDALETGGITSVRAVFEVGDELKLHCTAKIGSVRNTTIKWRKISKDSSGKNIEYQPPEGTYDDGTVFSDNQCGYTRTATIRYIVTTADALHGLAFECYVSVSGYPSTTVTPYGVYTTTNNPRYHVKVRSIPRCDSTTNVDVYLGVAIGSVVTTLTIVSFFAVFTKYVRSRCKQPEAREFPLATPAGYEGLDENTKDKNTYSHLNTEQN